MAARGNGPTMATAGGLFIADPAGDRPSFDRFKAALAAYHAKPCEQPDDPPAVALQPKAYDQSRSPAARAGRRRVRRLSAARLVGMVSFVVGITIGGTLVHAKLASWLRGEPPSASGPLSRSDEKVAAVGAKSSASAVVVAVYDGRILGFPAAASTSATTPRQPAAPAERPEQFRIQVAEVHSAAEVEAMWSGLVSRNSDLLAGLNRYLLRAEGVAGPLYLLQVGPFPNLQRALATCVDLGRFDDDCLVVRPS